MNNIRILLKEKSYKELIITIKQFEISIERYYSKEELSDKSERFFEGEIIREKIIMNYKKEVPYSVEFEIP